MIKRGITSEEIFNKRWDGIISYFNYGILPTNLLPTDKIYLEKDEGYYSENNSWDASSELTITRDRPETDEEWEKSKKFWADKAEESKAERRKTYEKLKKEFETNE